MSKKKFNVKCSEAITYKFNVMAENEDQALEIAHDILLGNDKTKGALRIEWPQEAYFEADCTEREWDISKAPKDDTKTIVDIKMLKQLDSSSKSNQTPTSKKWQTVPDYITKPFNATNITNNLSKDEFGNDIIDANVAIPFSTFINKLTTKDALIDYTSELLLNEIVYDQIQVSLAGADNDTGLIIMHVRMWPNFEECR